jgi:hypothetical protein
MLGASPLWLKVPLLLPCYLALLPPCSFAKFASRDAASEGSKTESGEMAEIELKIRLPIAIWQILSSFFLCVLEIAIHDDEPCQRNELEKPQEFYEMSTLFFSFSESPLRLSMP